MPFGSEGLEEGTGLALSGGGFRASLFHCGALWRLNELGHLARLRRISSVSGGSITSGVLALKWQELKAAGWDQEKLLSEVVEPIRSFCRRTVDVPSILKGIVLPWKSAGEWVASQYKDALFGDRTLQDLPDFPRFVFNSTNLATGVDFRFSKAYAGDYRIGLIDRPTFLLADAVAASSAFPPVLSPIVLKPDPSSFTRVAGADLYDDISFRRKLLLTDGGVYDNLGLEPLWKRLKTLFVSDAGAPFDYGGAQGRDWARQSLRVINVFSHQAWSLRTSLLVRLYRSQERTGAYWGIGTPITRYSTSPAFHVAPDLTRQIAKIRTRLNAFTDAEQCTLVNWGYAICDAAIAKYAPAAPVPARWPYPDYGLERGLPGNVQVSNRADPVEPLGEPDPGAKFGTTA